MAHCKSEQQQQQQQRWNTRTWSPCTAKGMPANDIKKSIFSRMSHEDILPPSPLLQPQKMNRLSDSAAIFYRSSANATRRSWCGQKTISFMRQWKRQNQFGTKWLFSQVIVVWVIWSYHASGYWKKAYLISSLKCYSLTNALVSLVYISRWARASSLGMSSIVDKSIDRHFHFVN